MEDLHKKIVDENLPRLAEKLKQEGIILNHDKKHFKKVKKLLGFRIYPDRVLHLSNGKNILVEVVNPEKPKRFIGELIYGKILIGYKEIFAAMFFVLYPQEQGIHERSLSQIHALSFLRLPKGSRIVTWPGEDAAYNQLKAFIKSLQSRKP